MEMPVSYCPYGIGFLASVDPDDEEIGQISRFSRQDSLVENRFADGLRIMANGHGKLLARRSAFNLDA